MSTVILKNNLKVYRKKFKITQEDIATKLGVKRSYFSDIERGVYIPSTQLAFQICSIINTIIFERAKLRTRILVDDLFYIYSVENDSSK